MGDIRDLYIGDPVLILQDRLFRIVQRLIDSRQYYICKESLQEFETAIRETLEKELECKASVKIPLIDSDDQDEWMRASNSRSCGEIWATAEKDFEGKNIRVVIP